jgi:hypothetical protein
LRAPKEPELVKIQMVLKRPEAATAANRPAEGMAPAEQIAQTTEAAKSPSVPAPMPSPRMGRLLRYSPIAKRTIKPAAPSMEPLRGAVETGGNLPCPVLPESLLAFRDPQLRPLFVEQYAVRKKSGWGQLFLVALLGLALGWAVHFAYVTYMERMDADTEVEATAAATAPGTKTGTAPSAPAVNLFAKSIEVTGFRIVMDPTRKSEVQYVVVNHSAVRFPDAKVYVTLYSTDAHAGQPPLCKFSFAAPNLGPFEAKEMASSVESTRPGNRPEWRDLRAEIAIGQ